MELYIKELFSELEVYDETVEKVELLYDLNYIENKYEIDLDWAIKDYHFLESLTFFESINENPNLELYHMILKDIKEDKDMSELDFLNFYRICQPSLIRIRDGKFYGQFSVACLFFAYCDEEFKECLIRGLKNLPRQNVLTEYIIESY